MPKPLPVDWELIKTLWIQGQAPAVIGARLGVNHHSIQTRARRYGWRRLRDAASDQVTKAVQTSLAGASERVRERLGAALELHAQAIPEARGWKHAARIQEELAPLVSNASKVFGWSGEALATLELPL